MTVRQSRLDKSTRDRHWIGLGAYLPPHLRARQGSISPCLVLFIGGWRVTEHPLKQYAIEGVLQEVSQPPPAPK